MSAVMTMAEQVYSVDVEMADGARKVLQFRTDNPGAAFRQARETPGVRRVGRVTVGSRTEHAEAGRPSPVVGRALPAGETSGRAQSAGETVTSRRANRPGSATRHQQQAPEAPVSEGHRGQILGQQITGPRLVRDARLLGGERPFANLPRPNRPDPVAPPPRKPKRAELEAEAAAARAREAAEQAAKAQAVEARAAEAQTKADATTATGERAYRIVKSRRKDGPPYLLQRGTWKQQGTKRVFEANWEKGFEVRDQAEKHLEWLEQHESEAAQVAQHAAAPAANPGV
jgi:hypothetical protein